MKHWLAAAGLIASCAVALLVIPSHRTEARDYGVAAQAFPIIEPDLLTTIERRLAAAEASGALTRTNAMFAQRSEAKVRRPTPVAGISPAEIPRVWDFDPSITLERDIHDQKGNLIAAAGQQINPLDFVVVRHDLIFIDGDDAAELAWATTRYTDIKAKIIFVSGSPIDAMSAAKRRFYFDQEGRLTRRFGIRHTPAVVSQSGKVMRVVEHVLKPAGAA